MCETLGGCYAAEGSNVICKIVQLTGGSHDEHSRVRVRASRRWPRSDWLLARPRLALARVLRLVFRTRQDHLRTQLCLQQNVYSRAIEDVVSPGRSVCAIEAVDVEMESPGVAAVAKV